MVVECGCVVGFDRGVVVVVVVVDQVYLLDWELCFIQCCERVADGVHG